MIQTFLRTHLILPLVLVKSFSLVSCIPNIHYLSYMQLYMQIYEKSFIITMHIQSIVNRIYTIPLDDLWYKKFETILNFIIRYCSLHLRYCSLHELIFLFRKYLQIINLVILKKKVHETMQKEKLESYFSDCL